MPRKNKYQKLHHHSNAQLSEESKQRVKQCFQKFYEYDCSTSYNEREIITELGKNHKKWYDSDLMTLKNDLNALKCELNDKDITKWQNHTNSTNISGRIVSEVKRRYSPELCTQAWAKFYEIISSFELLPENGEGFTSVHLCEGPGAFVTSLNHFLVSHKYRAKWTWLATTLNPYHESNNTVACIMDDRFLRHTLDRWEFGSGDTGDLMAGDVVDRLKARAGGVHLVTADGSIDCQSSPAEQEAIIFPLIATEVAAGLELLVPGGSMVVKMFTLFESNSVCLIYLLQLMFDQVTVLKPASSKAGNSEMYAVCQQLRLVEPTLHAAVIHSLRSFTGSSDKCLLSRAAIPDTFMSSHVKCARQFMQYQANTIKENLRLYNHMTTEDLTQFDLMRSHCMENYFVRYSLGSIDRDKRVVTTAPVKTAVTVDIMRKVGSYSEREDIKSLSWTERMKSRELMDVSTDFDQVLWRKELLDAETFRKISPTTGLPISCVNSSQLCSNILLRQTQDIIDDTQPALMVTSRHEEDNMIISSGDAEHSTNICTAHKFNETSKCDNKNSTKSHKNYDTINSSDTGHCMNICTNMKRKNYDDQNFVTSHKNNVSMNSHKESHKIVNFHKTDGRGDYNSICNGSNMDCVTSDKCEVIMDSLELFSRIQSEIRSDLRSTPKFLKQLKLVSLDSMLATKPTLFPQDRVPFLDLTSPLDHTPDLPMTLDLSVTPDLPMNHDLSVTSELPVNCDPLKHELSDRYRIRLLKLLTVFKKFEEYQCIVLQLHPMLTRFSASVLYSLHHIFGVVQLLPCTSSTHQGYFAVCMNYLPAPQTLYTGIDDVISMVKDATSDRTVLCFWPITDMLNDEKFMSVLKGSNHQILKLIHNYRLSLFDTYNSS